MNIEVGYVPAGIKFYKNGESLPQAELFHGISYCECVHKATTGSGTPYLLKAESIENCHWSPIVLGFRESDCTLDLKVGYNMNNIQALLIAPLPHYTTYGLTPDTVLVRSIPSEIAKLVKGSAREDVAWNLAGKLDSSALEIFDSETDASEKSRVMLVNKTLARLNKYSEWRKFTKWVFSNDATTYVFDLLLDRFLANMSMCRNTTVIPLVTGDINVSYFCTGGVAWGGNRPEHVTCGMPWAIAQKHTFTIA